MGKKQGKVYELTFTDYADGQPGETSVTIEGRTLAQLHDGVRATLEMQAQEIRRLFVAAAPKKVPQLVTDGAQPTDAVNHPAHYNAGKIEVIEFIEDQKLGFHLGNALKYVARAGRKDPAKAVQDLEKAIWYIRRDIAVRQGNPPRPNAMPQARVQ